MWAVKVFKQNDQVVSYLVNSSKGRRASRFLLDFSAGEKPTAVYELAGKHLRLP